MHSDVCSNFLEVNWTGFVIRAVFPDTVIYIYKSEYFIRSHSDFLNESFQIMLANYFAFLKRLSQKVKDNKL